MVPTLKNLYITDNVKIKQIFSSLLELIQKIYFNEEVESTEELMDNKTSISVKTMNIVKAEKKIEFETNFIQISMVWATIFIARTSIVNLEFYCTRQQ